MFDPITKKFLCDCGCGEEVSWPSNFRRGHSQRVNPSSGTSGYYMPKDEATKDLLSKSGLAYYANGGINGMEGKHQSPESIEKTRLGNIKFYEDNPKEREKRAQEHLGLIWSAEERDRHSEYMHCRLKKDPKLMERMSEARWDHSESLETSQKRIKSLERFWNSSEGSELKKKWSRERQGEGGQNWKGGFDYGYGYGWSAIRDFILSRDDDTCQGCGTKEGRLEVHHIDGDTDNVEEYNLITVCHSCNMVATSKKEGKYWKAYYVDRIREIYTTSKVGIV